MKVFGYVVLGFIVLSILGGMCGKLGQKPIDQEQLISEMGRSVEFQTLVSTRIVHRVDVHLDGIALIVGPAFYQLPFENKSAVCKTISSLAGPTRGGDSFAIRDWQTNRSVGTWLASAGLELDR